MKTKSMKLLVGLLAAIFLIISGGTALAAKPIVLGLPLSTAFLYGWDAERGVKLAVEEINATGGVNVGGKKRPFKVEVIDTRDLEPGVPGSVGQRSVGWVGGRDPRFLGRSSPCRGFR